MAEVLASTNPTYKTIEIAVEPAYNILNSMALLNEVEQMPALDEWALRTAAALTSEQRERNRLVFGVLREVLLLEGDWPDFPTYLDALTAQPSDRVRDRVLQQRAVDDKQLNEVRSLLTAPAELHDMIVSHLREMWEQYVAGEWRRVSGNLHGQTKAMLNNRLPEWKRAHLTKQGLPTTPDQYLATGVLSIEENLRTLISPELWSDPQLVTAATARIVYCNSAHVGRYVTWLHTGSTLRIFFHAVRNLPALMRTTPVGATELASRLSALADETRLKIMGLFAVQDAVSAQDIMTHLNLGQSATSRQLRPLLHFVNESRGKGANKLYYLSPAQVELTFRAVRELLAGQEAVSSYVDARLEQPEELRRYMNEQGKLTMLPLRHKDRIAALVLIASRFESGRTYTEKEVNEIIQEQITFQDFVSIRRALYDYKFMHRERDGSRYWLSDISEQQGLALL